MTEFVEYKIRPVTRYIITRFERSEEGTSTTSPCGTSSEFDNADLVYKVAYALAKADHDRLGWEVGDERIQYPKHPFSEVVSDYS